MGGAVYRHLLGPAPQHGVHVVGVAQPAAHGEWNEDLRGHALDKIAHDVAALRGGRDVVEDQLVGAFPVIARGQLDGIARIHVG